MRYQQIGCARLKGTIAAILLLSFLILGVPPAGAGQDKATEGGPILSELLKMPGKLLSKGVNRRSTGLLRLVSYRLEEIELSHPVEVSIRGQKSQADRAWRLTVTGGPFQVRALPPVIWVDGVAVGIAQENERLSELTVITFDLTALREGGTIAVSYGMDSEDRSELVDKLSVGSAR